MTRTNGKPKVEIHPVILTPEVAEALQQLSSDASDFLGRPIDRSAIVRALIRQVMKHGTWAPEALFLEVKRELKA